MGNADTSMDVDMNPSTPPHTLVLSVCTDTPLVLCCWSLTTHTNTHTHVHYAQKCPTGKLGSQADMVMRAERQSLSESLQSPSMSPSLFFPCPLSSHNPIQQHNSWVICRQYIIVILLMYLLIHYHYHYSLLKQITNYSPNVAHG